MSFIVEGTVRGRLPCVCIRSGKSRDLAGDLETSWKGRVGGTTPGLILHRLFIVADGAVTMTVSHTSLFRPWLRADPYHGLA